MAGPEGGFVRTTQNTQEALVTRDVPQYLHEVEDPPTRCSCDPDDPDHECPPNLDATGPLSTVCLWGDCEECDGVSNPDDVEGYDKGFPYGEGLVLCSHECHEWDEPVVALP